MQYATPKNKPRTLRSLTGFTPPEFEALLPSFGVAWERFVSETFKREGRQRSYGAGRKAHLKRLDDRFFHLGVLPNIPDAGSSRLPVWHESVASE